MKHTIYQIEIPVKDLEKASAFYARAFGWQIDSDVSLNAASFETGKAPGGFISRDETEPRCVTTFILTDDIEMDLDRIIRLGGTKVSDKEQLGEDGSKGWVARFRDPDGNLLGLFQRKQ